MNWLFFRIKANSRITKKSKFLTEKMEILRI